MKSALIAVCLFAAILPAAASASSPEKDDALVGKPVPVFRIADLAGNAVSSEELTRSGKVVLVNFWGLRCGACIEELPHLNALLERYGGQVEFLGVNVDAVPAETLDAQIRKKKLEIRSRVIPDPEFRMVDGFKMKGAPFTVIVDAKGIVRYQHENFEPGDEKKIEEALRQVLDGKAAGAR